MCHQCVSIGFHVKFIVRCVVEAQKWDAIFFMSIPIILNDKTHVTKNFVTQFQQPSLI